MPKSKKEQLEAEKKRLESKLKKIETKITDLNRPQPTSTDWFSFWYQI